MEKEIGEIDFAKSGGIVPVIVQDADTLKVLTLAYANKEALDLAKKTGNSWFWSRSRNKLWMKGEESGNTQKIKEILVDCDSDALVYLVKPSGPACHTGEGTAFKASTAEPPLVITSSTIATGLCGLPSIRFFAPCDFACLRT